MWMAVPNVSHIVDTIEILCAKFIVHILAFPANDFKRITLEEKCDTFAVNQSRESISIS